MAEPKARRLPAGIATRAASAQPATLNDKAREVDVTWSTGGRAMQWINCEIGMAPEELDMSPNAVRMGTLDSGNAPVLDTHCRDEADCVLGRVVAASLKGGEGIATLRFSAAEDVTPIWQRIKEGTLRSVSIGYRVYRYELIREADGTNVYRAVDWEPIEISVVPIPADPSATVRAEGGAPPVITDTTITNRAGAAAHNPEVRMDPTASPGAQGAPPVTTPPLAIVPTVDADAIRAQAIASERTRAAAIREVGRAAAGLVPADRLQQILDAADADGKATADSVRTQLFEAAAEAVRAAPTNPTQGTPRLEVGRSYDAPDAVREAMADAIAATHLPGIFKPVTDQYRTYAGWRPSHMAAELMRARGERPPVGPTQLAERSFHTTSDFPNLLASALNKMLMANYALNAPTYQTWMARRSFNDFKTTSFLRVGDFPNLLAIGESGEITSGTISENRETVTLATYARNIRVTRRVIINDDLGAFADFGMMIGRRVADFENATAYAVVNTASGNGPTLSEGSAAVFGTAAGRVNKAAAGTVIDVTNVAAGRAAMRAQKSIDSLILNLAPRYLVVSPAYETAAEQLVAVIQPQQASNVNVFSGRLVVVADANLPNNRWYLYADPSVAPVYVYGYLNGAEGPQVRSGPVQGVDGMEISVLLDFACGAIDWRGGWFNPGA